MYFDITVRNSLQPSYIVQAAHHAGAAAEAKKKTNTTKLRLQQHDDEILPHTNDNPNHEASHTTGDNEDGESEDDDTIEGIRGSWTVGPGSLTPRTTWPSSFYSALGQSAIRSSSRNAATTVSFREE